MGALYDVAVIGGGPAGLTAASIGARHALATVLFDEQPTLGGQIYRGVDKSSAFRSRIVGGEYRRGVALIEALRQSGATVVSDASVWAIERRSDEPQGFFDVGVAYGSTSVREVRFVQARAIILATGALERPFPIPGWTLPGVMTVGAAQTLLKSSGLVPQGSVVLAGLGPLLWLYAAQLLDAGASIDAILETTPRRNFLSAVPYAP